MDIEEIKRSFIERTYYMSPHASKERGRARLSTEEVEEAGSMASLLRIETHHSGGTRYLVGGSTQMGRIVHMVVIQSDIYDVAVLTVYERKPKGRSTR